MPFYPWLMPRSAEHCSFLIVPWSPLSLAGAWLTSGCGTVQGRWAQGGAQGIWAEDWLLQIWLSWKPGKEKGPLLAMAKPLGAPEGPAVVSVETIIS
jgi:hypothetical protein